MPNVPAPWERQPTESPKAFDAFCEYRNLPTATRSVDVAWRRSQSRRLDAANPTQADRLRLLPTRRADSSWRMWSSSFQWIARATAWDAEKDRIAREQIVKDHKAMLERHRTLGQALVQRVAERLQSLTGSDLKSHDIPNWLRAGVDIERKAFDLPDVVVSHSGQVEQHIDGVIEHTDNTYEALVRLLLDAPEDALFAADRLSGRLAATSALPRASVEPREAPENPAP